MARGQKLGFRHTEEAKAAISAGAKGAGRGGFNVKVQCPHCEPVMSPANLARHEDACTTASSYARFFNKPLSVRDFKSWRHKMRLNYGISVAEFEAMFDLQDGKCKICHGGPKGLHSTLVVDHDHETGAVRGLLCGSCNALLGMAGDDIEILDRARRYLHQQDTHA